MGFALLRWKGKRKGPIASHLTGCPHVSDLFVLEAYRSQGIGSQLLDILEDRVKGRGYHQIGLSVTLHNTRARALYERRGYQNAGFEPYENSWIELDEHGHEYEVHARNIYLIKQL